MMNNILPNGTLLLTKYLVNCCMRYELGVKELDDNEFEGVANTLVFRWHEIVHPYKSVIDLEMLKAGAHATYITFPVLIRKMAVEKATLIPDSPCFGWSYASKQQYCEAMQDKNCNHVPNFTA